MKKMSYTNPTTKPKYVAGRLVQPNETIVVDALDHPDYKVTGVGQGQPAKLHIVDVLFGGAESDLIAALPSLDTKDLEALGQREQEASTPRKNVLSAIAQAKLTRANAQHGGNTTAFDIKASVADLTAKLSELSNADLQALIDTETLGQNRKTLIEAATTEQTKRKAGSTE